MKESSENRGWSWYEAKYEMAEFILVKLKAYQVNYKKDGWAVPAWLLKEEEQKNEYSDQEAKELSELWVEKIDCMINAFSQILNYNVKFDENLGYDEAEIQKGLDLFAQHFIHFWD